MACPTLSLALSHLANKAYFEPSPLLLIFEYAPFILNSDMRQVLTECNARESLKKAGFKKLGGRE
jgi:hypothetical protein